MKIINTNVEPSFWRREIRRRQWRAFREVLTVMAVSLALTLAIGVLTLALTLALGGRP